MDTPDTILIEFGKRVRQLRQAKGLSQEDLAGLCQLDRTYISSLERGKRNVSLRNIAVIVNSLNISLSQFFEGITGDDESFDS